MDRTDTEWSGCGRSDSGEVLELILKASSSIRQIKFNTITCEEESNSLHPGMLSNLFDVLKPLGVLDRDALHYCTGTFRMKSRKGSDMTTRK